MVHLEGVFLMQIAMGILMIVFLQKQMQMKKQIDEITKEVMNYIFYITEDMEEELQAVSSVQKSISKEKQTDNIIEKKEKEEAQNRLIQAVLGDFFP